jgi:hypothetical protein
MKMGGKLPDITLDDKEESGTYLRNLIFAGH